MQLVVAWATSLPPFVGQSSLGGRQAAAAVDHRAGWRAPPSPGLTVRT